MKNILIALFSILVVSSLLYATSLPGDLTTETKVQQISSPSVINTWAYSSFSGWSPTTGSSSYDLGLSVCKHNILTYVSGSSWTTVPSGLPTSLVIRTEGSFDGTYFKLMKEGTVNPNATDGLAQSTDCYRYLRASWTSTIGGGTWASNGGRVNIQINSGGF